MSHDKANICGVEFIAGQSIDGAGSGRCGSLLTCVFEGRSVLHGEVVKFFTHICENMNELFVFIDWFRVPDYPMNGTPLVVRVSDNAITCHTPKVVSTFDMDPSRIIIERCDNETCYYVCVG